MEKELSFTAEESDILKEVANVGAGNASVSLSNLLNKKVNLYISGVNLTSLSKIGDLVKGPQSMVVGIYAPVSQGISGNIAIVFDVVSAKLLANSVTKTADANLETLSETDKKSLTRVGDLLSSAYIDSLNQFMSSNMTYDKTSIVTTFGESIIDIIMLGMDSNAQNCLLISTQFDVEGTKIRGNFILLLALNSVKTLMDTLKSQLG